MSNKEQANIQELLELDESTIIRISKELSEMKSSLKTNFDFVRNICKDMSLPEKELMLKGFIAGRVLANGREEASGQNLNNKSSV